MAILRDRDAAWRVMRCCGGVGSETEKWIGVTPREGRCGPGREDKHASTCADCAAGVALMLARTCSARGT